MAKFTVFFKDKVIHSDFFESGIVHIGRDQANDLIIDSLAVAPVHAAVAISEDGCTIKQFNDEFPLIINGEKVKAGRLINNDVISMGKHDITFNTTEPVEFPATFSRAFNQDVKSLKQEVDVGLSVPAANLQFMNGHNIGKILQLKKPMIRLGHNGSGVIAISKRKEGYFVSVLENSGTITVNNESLSDKSLKLNTNDVLVVDHTSLQFFLN